LTCAVFVCGEDVVMISAVFVSAEDVMISAVCVSAKDDMIGTYLLFLSVLKML